MFEQVSQGSAVCHGEVLAAKIVDRFRKVG
jgi:hypothetical protein